MSATILPANLWIHPCPQHHHRNAWIIYKDPRDEHWYSRYGPWPGCTPERYRLKTARRLRRVAGATDANNAVLQKQKRGYFYHGLAWMDIVTGDITPFSRASTNPALSQVSRVLSAVDTGSDRRLVQCPRSIK